MVENHAFDIEKSLQELVEEIKDSPIAGTVREVWDSFKNKRILLADLAFKDPSTGLFNKFYFDSRLEEEIGRASRYQRELTVLVALFGPSSSSGFSRAVSSICTSLRQSDTCATLEEGGLYVILPETNLGQAEKAAVKLHEIIREELKDVKPEVWIGLADFTSERSSPSQLVEAARSACENAKKQQLPFYTAADSPKKE